MVFPEDGGPNKSVILEGLIIPEASLRIVSLVFSAKLIPTQLKADSAMFLAALGSEGRALSPI